MDTPRFEVIPARKWRNSATGATASLYGAAPYVSEADKADWTVETVGWTIRNNRDGTIGIGRSPFVTKEEADAYIVKLDALYSR